MRLAARVAAACAVVPVGLLVGSLSSAAAVEPISGQLDKAGYTVIALAANGDARAVVASDGSFSFRPPADTSTLHLRAADGTYAGPVVLGEKGGQVAQAKRKVRRAKRKVRRAKRNLREARASGEQVRRAKRRLRRAKRRLARAKKRLEVAKQERADRPNRAILGVRDGTDLGEVDVRSAGYAKTAPVDESQLDATRISRARNGVPVGTGVFGRVASPYLPDAAPGDADVDGIPNVLDIDDDGDLILDDFDSSLGASAAQVQQQFRISSQLVLPIQFSVNVNGGSSNEEIAAALSNAGGEHSGGRLYIEPLSGDAPPELDCGGTPNPTPPPPRVGGLVYCSTGGTGRVFQPGVEFEDWPFFPDDYDPDGDGFGALGSFGGGVLSHGANSDQIKTGDLLIQRVVRVGVEELFTATVQYIFVTGPALAAWSDTAGHSGNVTYPRGTDPFTVAPGADGNIELTLTLWRPQRKRIAADPAPGPGESAEWTDIGGLTYEVGISNVEDDPGHQGLCPEASMSTNDPNLTPSGVPPGSLMSGLVDGAADHPANPANTLTFTLNATQCLTANGVTWNPDKTVGFDLFAKVEQNANAHQGGVPFKRAP